MYVDSRENLCLCVCSSFARAFAISFSVTLVYSNLVNGDFVCGPMYFV